MAYPTGLDTLYTTTANTPIDGQPAWAAWFTDIQNAITAIETTLGLSPQGGSATVSARIAAVAAATPATPIHSYFLMGA